MNTEVLITIDAITYTYPVIRQKNATLIPLPALDNLSLQIYQGEYLAILGHNGSGKSTLARHCNALLVPDEGRVSVTGIDTKDATKQHLVRDTVGLIMQNPDNQIIATLVEDDVAWGLAVRGFPRQLIRERVEFAMQAVGISHLRAFPPHKLSGGQRQRVAIAGMLALQPRCIIADEATAMLDPISRQEIVALLGELHRDYGLTIVHVTHLLEETAQAQRIIVMERGHIEMTGTPATIFADVQRLEALKLEIPSPMALVARLRAVGFPISPDAVTLENIARELAH